MADWTEAAAASKGISLDVSPVKTVYGGGQFGNRLLPAETPNVLASISNQQLHYG